MKKENTAEMQKDEIRMGSAPKQAPNPNGFTNIEPDEIVVDDDSDMPKPETKQYEQMIKLTDKFITLFGDVVGNMKYATTLSNTQGNKIKLIDLVRFVEAKRESMSINELNTIIGFIANVEFKYARPLMELIETTEGQTELWVAAQ